MKKTLLSVMTLAGALAMNAQNPFAYGLASEDYDATETSTFKVQYSLNADATAVKLQVLNGETVVVETACEGKTKGSHVAEIDLSSLENGEYTWQIAVTGGATSGDVKEFFSVGWNHPRGVDTDRNFESPHFGNIYVTEGRSSANTKYYSCSSTGGGNGLYIFTPDMKGVKNNATGKFAFMGGLTVDQKVPSGTNIATTSGADLARVRVAEDGRIFVTRLNDSGSYICVAESADDLMENDRFTSLLGSGSVSTADFGFYNSNSEFVAGPNLGFDVKGSGDNLKMLTIAAMKDLWYIKSAGSFVHEYELGTETTLPTPTEISGLHKKYTVVPQSTSICYDNRGGIWYCQYRTDHTANQPSLVYIDANGTQKYFEGNADITRGGSGIRLSPDFTQLAICSATSSKNSSNKNVIAETHFTIYDVTYADDNTPTLTSKYVVKGGMGFNINDIAWDLASNIYMVSNGGELFKGFAVPRANNTFATKAASKYGFTKEGGVITEVETIKAENAPVEYYNLQGVKVENPTKGIFIKKQGAKATKVIL